MNVYRRAGGLLISVVMALGLGLSLATAASANAKSSGTARTHSPTTTVSTTKKGARPRHHARHRHPRHDQRATRTHAGAATTHPAHPSHPRHPTHPTHPVTPAHHSGHATGRGESGSTASGAGSTGTNATTTTLTGGAPAVNSSSTFGVGGPDEVVLHTGMVVGEPFAERPVSVRVGALGRTTDVVVSVHSKPEVLLNTMVSPSGAAGVSTNLPSSLPAGVHVIVARASATHHSYVAALPFSINAAGVVTAIGPSSLLTSSQTISDATMALSLATNRPVYDTGAHPLGSSGVVIAGAALLSLAAIGSVAGASSVLGGASGSGDSVVAGSNERRDGRELAEDAIEGLELMALEKVGQDREAWGDRSRTWRLPGTSWVDRTFSSAAARVSGSSALVPRVVVDGTWARAMFGSGSLVFVALGLVIGVVGAVSAPFTPLVPLFSVLLSLLVLSAFDALAAVVGWLVLVVGAVIIGRGLDLAGVRTALALAIMVVATSTLAQVVRPLRRFLLGSETERIERLIDYLLIPFVVAFGVGASLKGLNGLSGLEIASPAQIELASWVVAGMILVRLALEDVATHFYPKRMTAVHPAHLEELSPRATLGAIVVRTVIFFLVAVPYIGFDATTVAGAASVVVPQVGHLLDARLPDVTWLDRWLPRGFTLFALTLVLGHFVSELLVGSPGTAGSMRGAFVWIILPSVIFKALEPMAKRPVAPLGRVARYALGAPLALGAILIGTGAIVLVH